MLTITPQDVESLWQKYLRSERENLALRDQLVEHYIPWAESVVSKIRLASSQNIDRQACENAGRQGLVKALEKFDPQRGVRFESFASAIVFGAFFDEARSQGRFGKHVYRKLQQENRLPQLFSLEEETATGPLGKKVIDLHAHPWEFDELFEDVTKSLSFKERVQLYLYHHSGLKLNEIATIMGITKGAVSHALSRATAWMRRTNLDYAARDGAPPRRRRRMNPKRGK
jgi:RNA polymerase sigma factor for flagellar operon FliA